MINIEKPIDLNSPSYEASLSISTSILPLEIVQKISTYMCQGTKIQFKRVSNTCHKAILLDLKAKPFSDVENEIINNAKMIFKFINGTNDDDRIAGFEYAIEHGFYSFDKAKSCVDQIFSQNQNNRSYKVYLGAFYGRLGLEHFRQCDFLNAEAALSESFRARPEGGLMAHELGKALYIHYYRRNELDQCARIKINYPQLYFSEKAISKAIKLIGHFSF